MGGYGAAACELGVGMHSAHRVCKAVACRACSHVVGMQSSSGTASGSNGEVLLAVFDAPFLVCSCNGMLESGGVGGVAGYGNINLLKSHDCNALVDIVGAVAANLALLTVGESFLIDDVELIGVFVVLGLNVSEAVNTRYDVCRILAETVEDNAKGLCSDLVSLLGNADSTFGCSKAFVTGKESEAFGFFTKELSTQIAVTETDFSLVGNGTGNTEGLKPEPERFGSFCC